MSNKPTLISEKPPEDGAPVLVWYDNYRWSVMSRREDDWYDENENYDDSELPITHWLPLPEPPND